MFVMDYYGHKLSNGVLFAHHLILDVPGGSSHLGYRRRVPPGHNPHTRVNVQLLAYIYAYKTHSNTQHIFKHHFWIQRDLINLSTKLHARPPYTKHLAPPRE